MRADLRTLLWKSIAYPKKAKSMEKKNKKKKKKKVEITDLIWTSAPSKRHEEARSDRDI